MDHVRTGKMCGEQLLVIINDILDLSKMEENKMTLENTEFDLRETCEESLEIVSFNAESRKLELICDIDRSVPGKVVGDFCRLRQILVNLLSNAVKFSTEGEVILKAQSEILDNKSCRITFSVKDRGIGIPQDRQHLIFQPFVQADTSTSRKYVNLFIFFSKFFFREEQVWV